MDYSNIKLNECQTPINDLNLDSCSEEIKEQFWTFFWNVPLIQRMVSKDRPRAKDRPRDKSGKIIVDITNPHILEDMDYFTPAARVFKETGSYTKLKPNSNPNSEYGKWAREEIRRCLDGYVRESDGEWIPGDLYFFWNYTTMSIAEKVDNNSNMAIRGVSFPHIWEGHYWKFHYLEQARANGKHALELSRRGSGKSFTAGALVARRFILGERKSFDEETQKRLNKKNICYAAASEKKYLIAGDNTLDKYQYDIDFLAENTEWPRKRLANSQNNMQWTLGYQDLDTGTKKGCLNSVIGVSMKDDESKLRGTRGILYIFEEAGSFGRLLEVWNNQLPSVEDGANVFGMLFGFGTAGDNNSDFYAMSEMMYHPLGYHVYGINNVYDIEGKGGKIFSFFFPGYMNRANCYDKNGNSDVTKALLEILLDRNLMKYNSTDINAVSKRTAEIPITPQEAILRTKGNMFPVSLLTERLNEIDNNPNFYHDTYVGELIQNKEGKIEFKPTADTPIRNFPTKDNKVTGAIEIFELPQEVQGKIPIDRYIISLDNYENDASNTMSLGSLFVLDLWTDRIVAEYTGRPMFSDDLNEIARKMCLFYNAKLLYENNKKATFAYFSRMNSLYLLEDTPEYLRQKDLVKTIGFGNSSKGVTATVPIKNHGFTLIRDWLLKPVTTITKVDREEQEVTFPNLHFIKNRALLKELILFNPDINVDRIMSLIQLMIFRESKMTLYGGMPSEKNMKSDGDELANDPFFEKNYRKNKYDLYL